MEIKIKRVGAGKLPEYKTEGSAGADCFARIDERYILRPKTVATIPLGFSVEIPEGYEMQIRGRSGNARKNWVQVFNSPGTIDSDYRGEVGAILYNASSEDFVIEPFDRIAQVVIAPVIKAEWKEVSKLSTTDRGAKGFGSTGKAENEKSNEKFYEPFKHSSECRQYIGKMISVDDNQIAKIITVEDTDFGVKFLIRYINKGFMKEECSALSLYQRAIVDGHRFGKEIEN